MCDSSYAMPLCHVQVEEVRFKSFVREVVTALTAAQSRPIIQVYRRAKEAAWQRCPFKAPVMQLG